MHYPVYVHAEEGSAFGVTVPDFPGCFSAADDLDDIKEKVQEAIEVYCEGETMSLPLPSSMSELIASGDYTDGFWMVVDIDASRLDTTPVRLNVSLPKGLVEKIDQYAKGHGMTRSGFLADAARRVME